MPLRLDVRRILAYAAVYILWGATYLAVRTVVLVTPPFSAAALRFLLSGLILLAISRYNSRHEPWPSRVEWVNSAKLGFAMFAINYACFFWAEQRLYSGTAAVVVATMPVWIFLCEWLFARTQRLSLGIAIGSALGIGGVVLLTRSGSAAASSPSVTHLATLVLLCGTITWSAGSVWSRSLQLPSQQSMRSALQMTMGGAFLVPLALAFGEGRLVVHALSQWTAATLLCFVYLIVASIVAFTAYVWLLHHEPAGRVASYAYVNPLVAIALGAGLGQERFGPTQILGAGLVLLGVFATLRMKARCTTPTHER
jgi:drug/metabolite transporter (DMT)-like permease